jgi:hypothetical protein
MQWLRESREIAPGTGAPLPSGKKMVLFYSPEMKLLAEEILHLSGNQGLLVPGEIEWKNFEDGFPNLFINHVDSIRGRHAVFLASFLNPSTLLAQLAGICFLSGTLCFSRSHTFVLRVQSSTHCPSTW